MNIAEESFPVYLNPDFDECIKLGKSSWDTLRICEDEEFLAIASGYGNNHQSICVQVRNYLGRKRWHPSTFIAYRKYGKVYINCEDVSGNDAVPWRDAIKNIFLDRSITMLRDIFQASEEAVILSNEFDS